MTARHPAPYDTDALADRIARHWDAEITGELTEYIRLPAKSPHFDAKWRENGHIEAAVQQALAWARRQPVISGCLSRWP